MRLLSGWALSSLEVWALLSAARKAPARARLLVEVLARSLGARLPRLAA